MLNKALYPTEYTKLIQFKASFLFAGIGSVGETVDNYIILIIETNLTHNLP